MLSGPVVRVVTRHVHVQPDSTETPDRTTVDEYDVAGHLITTTSYRADGSVSSRTAFKYDADGCRYESTHQNPDGSVVTTPVPARPIHPVGKARVEHFHDQRAHGYFIEGLDGMGFSARPGAHVRVFYDPDGRARLAALRNRFGWPIGRTTFDYDEQGRLTGFAQYGWGNMGEGTIDSKRSRVMTRLFLLIGLPVVRAVLFIRTLFAHVRHGNLVRARRCLVYGTLFFEEFRAYDEGGYVSERRMVLCGGVDEDKTTYSNDHRGLVLEQQTWTHGKLAVSERFSREFDGQGNWTKETVIHSPGRRCGQDSCQTTAEATSITYREVAYASEA